MYSGKVSLDKFYTKLSVAKMCIGVIDLSSYATVIEPSAGNGAFSSQITHEALLAFDLLPQSDNVVKKDWFTYKHQREGRTLVIGNPPFGLRNVLSKGFITHAIKFADTIAMILPNVFHKHTMQSIFPTGWRLKEVHDIGNDAFLIDGVPYHVPCSFFVFDKSEGTNLMFDVGKYQSCKDFEWCSKYVADWFVMGASPKTIKHPSEVTENNRGYYFKAVGISKKELAKKWRETNWVGHSSVNGGASWRTKPELVKYYKDCNDV